MEADHASHGSSAIDSPGFETSAGGPRETKTPAHSPGLKLLPVPLKFVVGVSQGHGREQGVEVRVGGADDNHGRRQVPKHDFGEPGQVLGIQVFYSERVSGERARRWSFTRTISLIDLAK